MSAPRWRRTGDRAGHEPIEPSRASARDLVVESFCGLFARPLRMTLTVLGTVIGIAALVATVGLSRTAGNQIIARFDALAATELTVTSNSVEADAPVNTLPWDSVERVTRLNGVVSAGTLSDVDVGKALVTASPMVDPQRQTRFKLPIVAASPELFGTVGAQLRTGLLLDRGHSLRADRVALLGPNAAEQLGGTSVDQLPAISIGDEVFLVVGILESVETKHELVSSVVLPEGTARRLYHLEAPGALVIRTAVGAAALLSNQVTFALRPENPLGFVVASPEERQAARAGVRSDLELLFLMLGGVSLLVGAIGIANVTLVSVMERVGEIGLRRALGATRRHIALQFLLESAAVGVLGGVLGASLGMIVVVGVAGYHTWTPVVDPLLPLLSPLMGGVTGLLAGAYPAIRAAGLEPVEALRAGT